jgi:hypothetical protein
MTTNPIDVVNLLDSWGVDVRLTGGQLEARQRDGGGLPASTASYIRRHKPSIIAVLQERSQHVIEAQATTGRPYSFDNGFAPLVDVPLRPEMSQREYINVLSRLLCIEATLHHLAADVSDIGLAASWLRLESVDDDIDDAIEKVTDAIRKRGQHG